MKIITSENIIKLIFLKSNHEEIIKKLFLVY